MKNRSYYIINGITLYRLISAPLLLVLIFLDQLPVFRWLLPISFFTDAIDGPLARKFKAESKFGTKLDSLADDFTVITGVTGLFFFRWEFVKEEYIWLVIVLGLFLFQTMLALVKYGKITSFHTWLAKTAAVFQGVFLISAFFLDNPVSWLFHTAVVLTCIELIEEIIIIFLLKEWRSNVKTVFHVLLRSSLQGK